MNKQYIVVEGPIGVGKTSLAKRLAESFGSELILEDAAANPFLTQFYQNPNQSALPTQLYFLFQRAQQMQELVQNDLFNPVRVSDFLLDKDRLFAELTLDAHELSLYEQVYATLEIDPPEPDLVIYLQAPVSVLKQRIQMRGIDREQKMDTGYLDELVESYAQFFHDYRRSPLLIVNASQIDLVNNDQHYEQLLQRILAMDTGRYYFNLLPAML